MSNSDQETTQNQNEIDSHFHFPGARFQQLRLRTERAFPPSLRSRRPQHRLARPMGDRSLQASSAFPQRGSVQEDLGHVDRVQGDRLQDCQRVEVITSGTGARSTATAHSAKRNIVKN